MSMLSEQANRLREIAHSLELFPIHDFTATSNEIRQAADTIEALSAKLAAANMERSDRYYGGGWIAISDRLPTKEESIRNDNRFILDDGNRRYEGCFDYVGNRFVRFNCDGMQTDECAIAWCEFPDRYRP